MANETKTRSYAIKFGKGYQEYYKKYYYKYTEHDAKANDPKSYYNLAEYYRYNNDAQKAKEYYKKSFDMYQQYEKINDPKAYYYLGYFYQYGYGVEENLAMAEEYYSKAYAELSKYVGKAEYYYLLGKMYESGYNDGKIGNADYQKAAYYYGQAAYMHYPDAYYRLGYLDASQLP